MQSISKKMIREYVVTYTDFHDCFVNREAAHYRRKQNEISCWSEVKCMNNIENMIRNQTEPINIMVFHGINS